MELYDTNHDGFLDAKELEKAPGLKAALKEVDADHDGKISQQEIADRIKYWADSRAGRIPMTCLVTRNGKALVGAKVVSHRRSSWGARSSLAPGPPLHRATPISPAPMRPIPGYRAFPPASIA